MLNQYEESIRCYDKALQIDSRQVEAFFNKANSLDSLGRKLEASQTYRQFLVLAPDSPQYAELVKYARQRIREFEKGVLRTGLWRFIERYRMAALNNKGNRLDDRGRYEEAISYYDKALKIDTRYFRALNNKGNSLNNLGRYEDALYCLDQALEIDPSYMKAWNNKGRSLVSLGRYEKAIYCFDQALEIDPSYEVALFNKANCLKIMGHN
jgi:tetratricopeptide (TPR) repeat protein